MECFLLLFRLAMEERLCLEFFLLLSLALNGQIRLQTLFFLVPLWLDALGRFGLKLFVFLTLDGRPHLELFILAPLARVGDYPL